MDANKHFFNFNNANLIYNNINISYYRLHGCLFVLLFLIFSHHATAWLHQIMNRLAQKIHPLWLHICY